MSIILMTFIKKQYILYLIFSFVIIGGIFFFRAQIRYPHALLKDFWGLLQEKIPKSSIILEQVYLKKRKTSSKETNNSLKFEINSRLFSDNYSTGQILSGQLNIRTLRQEGKRNHTDKLDIHFSGYIVGLQDKETNINTQITVDIEAKIKNSDIYFKIPKMSFQQKPQNIEEMMLWYLLLKKYEDTRIHISKEDIPFIQILHPRWTTDIISKNSKKARIFPDKKKGWVYSFSGNSLIGSGNYKDETHNELTLSFPKHSIVIQKKSTKTSSSKNISIVQKNHYSGSFHGTTQQIFGRNTLKTYATGNFIRPGGINIDLDTKILQKRCSLKPSPIPQQYLERETIIKRREKK